MSRLMSVLGKVLVILVVLSILIAAGGVFLVRRSFPVAEGEIRLTGLGGPVNVYRDDHGIPHIYGSSLEDIFFAQGYVHAQDRFWQMDVNRHIGRGRTAEMFGEGGVGNDLFLRTLGWERIAEEEYQLLEPETRQMLDAYVEGVNAYLTDHKGTSISLEYGVLNLINPDYQLAPWSPIDTLTWAKVMAWDLKGNINEEISRALLLSRLTEDEIAEIIPPYPGDAPVILPDFSLESSATIRVETPNKDLAALIPKGAVLALERALASSTGLDALLGPSGPEIGSNNWVISGDLTATGMPLLANDPHLGVQLPSIWYENGLHCDPVGPGCPIDVVGFSFPGAPAVIVGHNDRIAWGVTNVGPDVMDLYIEKVNPENPNQYEFDGEWVDMEVVQETVEVGGGQPVNLIIRRTHHGPIISDTYGRLEGFRENTILDIPEDYAIALRWTALEPTQLFQAIFSFNTAQGWNDFREGASFFVVPSQNLVYADVEGNIGYQMPGWIPIRQDGHDGKLPVPGWTDAYEWQGYVPFEELPYTFNPERGYVATANNAVVSDDYPYLISSDWDYGSRAARIVEMIEQAPGPIDIPYIQQMQGDNRDLGAEIVVPLILEIPLNDARLEEAKDLLRGWDYQMDMDSAPAALYANFWRYVLGRTFYDQLPGNEMPDGGTRWFVVFDHLVDNSDNDWWDDKNTPGIESRNDILRLAFSDAVDDLEERLGRDLRNWTWGDLHTVTFANSTLGEPPSPAVIRSLLNRGPYPASGSSSVVNNTAWNAASLEEPFAVQSLPSMRMIVDLSDLSNSLTTHTVGQSGHAFHPHYADMVELWQNIEYHPMYWAKDAVEAEAESLLRLVPTQ